MVGEFRILYYICYDIQCITDTINTTHFNYNNNMINSLSNFHAYCYTIIVNYRDKNIHPRRREGQCQP